MSAKQHGFNVRRNRILVAACALLMTAVGGASVQADQQDTIPVSVPYLTAYTVQPLVIEQVSPGELSVAIQIDGESRTLEMRLHSVRADGFQVLVQIDATGELHPVDAPPVSTYRGSVVEIPGSVVAGSYWDGQLRAVIHTPDQTYGIEPLAAEMGGTPGDHLVYRASDSVALGEGFCGTLEGVVDLPAGGAGSRGANMEVVDLGVDADFEYYQINNSDVGSTVRDIEGVINGVQSIYEVPAIAITYELTTVVVRTSEPDPYSSSDAGTLLNQFQSTWNTSPEISIRRDVAELFTGKNVQSGILGIAITSTVCLQSLAYSVVESQFTGSFTTRLELSAHELGHNWSALHCDGLGADCKIMCSVLGDCTGVQNEFGNSSASAILGFKNTRGCLSDVPDPVSMPFFDSFDSTTIDTDKWTFINGGVINSNAIGEPSPSLSMNLDAGGSGLYLDDDIRTNEILLTGATEPVLQFWTQHDGVEDGEELIVDYYSLTGEWKELERIMSDGTDQTAFDLHMIDIPVLGFHDGFRVRFRTEVDNVNDEWFIDNVIVSEGGEGDFTPPSPNPMTFAAPPAPLDDTSILMVATAATDDTLPIEYQFDFVSGGPNGSDSDWQTSTTYINEGLVANNLYTYRVRARDNADFPNQTSYSDEAETATAIQSPTTLLVASPTTDSLTLVTLDSFTNLTLAESGLYFDSLTAGGDGGINQWVQIIVDTATGLSPDTMYEFQVKGRNQLGVETAYSPSTSGTTLANVPGAPLLSGANCDRLNVNVDPNGNPSTTTFAIQITDSSPFDGTWDGMYVDASGDPSAAAVFRTDSTWGTMSVMGLAASTSYTMAVTAQNQDGAQTDQGPEDSLTTTADCDESCEGDVNGDNTVDPLDTGFVLARFGCAVGTGDPNCDDADVNNDGAVDPLDVGFVLARFGACD